MTEADNTSRLTLQDFEFSRGLGTGAYGTVVLATYRQATAVPEDAADDEQVTGCWPGLVAVKQQPKTTDKVGRAYQQDERSIMEELRGSPFCIQLLGSFQTNAFLYLVVEYCGGSSLQDHIKKGTVFTGPAVTYLAAELCDALCFLHGRDIMHRDVNPGNILFDSRGHSRLCDFGLALREDWAQKCSEWTGTVEFWAPELVSEFPEYDHMVDWWALGVSLLNLVQGANPYDVGMHIEHPDYYYVLQDRILNYQVPKELGVPIWQFGLLKPGISALIRDLLVKDPDQRLGSQLGAVREHPVFHHRLLAFTPQSWEDLKRGLLPPPLTKPEVGHKLAQAQWRQDIKLREDPALLNEDWDLDPYPDYDSNFCGVGSTAL